MLDFDVQRCTRRCATTDQDLKPAEVFYSELVSEGAEVVRRDYCQDAWKGPAEKALGWWKSQMPSPNARKMHWAPNDVMLHYFEQLENQPGKEDVRYILALLMLRRRIVRLEETESNEASPESLSLYCPRNENQYEIPVASPNEKRIGEIQQELAQLLQANTE